MSKYGITNTQQALKVSIRITLKIDKLQKKGIIGIILGVLGILIINAKSIIKVFKNWRSILNELKDLQPNEKDALVIYIKGTFRLSNRNAEQKVEAVIKWILQTVETVNIFKK